MLFYLQRFIRTSRYAMIIILASVFFYFFLSLFIYFNDYKIGFDARIVCGILDSVRIEEYIY